MMASVEWGSLDLSRGVLLWTCSSSYHCVPYLGAFLSVSLHVEKQKIIYPNYA